jgi:hypothetical protein
MVRLKHLHLELHPPRRDLDIGKVSSKRLWLDGMSRRQPALQQLRPRSGDGDCIAQESHGLRSATVDVGLVVRFRLSAVAIHGALQTLLVSGPRMTCAALSPS